MYIVNDTHFLSSYPPENPCTHNESTKDPQVYHSRYSPKPADSTTLPTSMPAYIPGYTSKAVDNTNPPQQEGGYINQSNQHGTTASSYNQKYPVPR